MEVITKLGIIPAHYSGGIAPLGFWHQRGLTLMVMLHPAIRSARMETVRTSSSPPAIVVSHEEFEKKCSAEHGVMGLIIAEETGLHYSKCERRYISELRVAGLPWNHWNTASA